MVILFNVFFEQTTTSHMRMNARDRHTKSQKTNKLGTLSLDNAFIATINN